MGTAAVGQLREASTTPLTRPEAVTQHGTCFALVRWRDQSVCACCQQQLHAADTYLLIWLSRGLQRQQDNKFLYRVW